MQSLCSLFVEGKGSGTPPPNSQGANQRVFEGPGAIPGSHNGVVNLLLILNFERIGSQYHLDVVCNFLTRAFVKALEGPDHFEDRDQADEPWFFFREAAGNDFGRAGRLHGIVLHQKAQEDVRVEPDHFVRLNLSVAPVSMAASISSRATGLAGFGMIPFSRDVGILGRIITPSGWKKNLNRSPGLRCKRSRTALGMVACPLLLSVASIDARSSTPYILAKVKKLVLHF